MSNRRDIGNVEAEEMVVATEEIVAMVRERGRRLGVAPEEYALTVLGHAYSYVIADAIGIDADRDRQEAGIQIGIAHISQATPYYLELKMAARKK